MGQTLITTNCACSTKAPAESNHPLEGGGIHVIVGYTSCFWRGRRVDQQSSSILKAGILPFPNHPIRRHSLNLDRNKSNFSGNPLRGPIHAGGRGLPAASPPGAGPTSLRGLPGLPEGARRGRRRCRSSEGLPDRFRGGAAGPRQRAAE